MPSQKQKSSATKHTRVSAVVVSYNRELLIGAVLRSVQFCDEVILIDKSSTDTTRAIAQPLCDKIIVVPWSPTVEETRDQAVKTASNDWIIMLDDDEVLNLKAVDWIKSELESPRAEVYGLPQRHYIMGQHDPNAYYWPEHQIRFFNKKYVAFTGTVHGGIQTDMDKVHWIDPTSGVGIEHLSHPDVETWISKTNRYTSRIDRVRPHSADPDLAAFTANSLALWLGKSRVQHPGDYPQAAALLRTIYDLIDRLKVWEEERGLNGHELFIQRAKELSTEHIIAFGGAFPQRKGDVIGVVHKPTSALPDQTITEMVAHLKISHKASLDKLAKEVRNIREELKEAQAKNRLQEKEIRIYRVIAKTKVKTVLQNILAKVPALWHFLERIVKTFRLIRQGRFIAHLKNYVRFKRRIYRERMEIFTYKRASLKKIDPEGVLKGLRKGLRAPKANSLTLSTSKSPTVSIIIPCYGQVDYTLRCLSSLMIAPPKVPFEVLVVEDASGDPRTAEIRNVKGIRYLERTTNLGFLRSCNDAVKQSRGTYVFLLNNDTYVMRGAVDALLDLLEARPDAGMVGARLIYPDGILQEAGGIVWDDGSAWNYGRRDIPMKPEYCYVREADYVSGAAIMLARSLWDKLGGFDEIFLPAYCEDSDLAFRIRSEGLKVLYQPNAWIVHDEGVSHGTDVHTGIKAYQIENNKRLKERWDETFCRDHFPSGTHLIRARDKAKNRKVTLVIDHYIPEPDHDAGSRSMVFFMEALLKAGHVVKIWPDNCYATPFYTEALQQRGIEVLHGITTHGFANWIATNGVDIDEVFLSRPTVAPKYVSLLRKHTNAPIVFYGHDLHFARMMLEAEVSKDPTMKSAALRMKNEEIAIWKSVDLCLYPSDDEIFALHEIAPNVPAMSISPYAFPMATPRTTPPKPDSGILFVAGFAHTPNVDAALWFTNEVLPLIRKVKPDIRLTLMGSNPTHQVKALASPLIDVTGYVTDEQLAEAYTKARVAIAPLRFGAGVKLKVVEGMRAGLPVVTTPIGAQGLKNVEGSLEICETAKSFAAAVLHFLADDIAWIDRTAKQVSYINDTFSTDALANDLQQAFDTATQSLKKRQST